MTKGPLGRELRLVNDDKSILVVLGIDGTDPPNDVQIALETSVEQSLKVKERQGGNNFIESVNLKINGNPTAEDRDALGGATLHVQQFEVNTNQKEVSQELINAVHNDVVDEVRDLGFNIVGTETTVV